MATDVQVPALGESITEGTLAQWLKKPGDAVAADEPIASLETDKVTVEVPSPVAGTFGEALVQEGETVAVGALIARIEDGGAATAAPSAPAPAVAAADATTNPAGAGENPTLRGAAHAPEPGPRDETSSGDQPPPAEQQDADQPEGGDPITTLSPAVRRAVLEHHVDPSKIKGTGRDGRLTKDDVVAAAQAQKAGSAAQPVGPAQAGTSGQESTGASPSRDPGLRRDDAPDRKEERVPMSRLRKTIAARLKEAQNTAALLTTFNDVDMSAVIEARSRYKDLFEKKHGIRLGFMGFFVKAVALATRDVPSVNGRIDGDEIVYQDYLDVSVAVSAPKGLVVPVVRNAQAMGFAEIEKTIADYGKRAKDGTLGIEEMQGGTFTISNGGVFGSLLSTPIINPPQSAVLGMHRIEERPVVRDGQVVVRPMMYLALSYDHRLVDGREAVTFLVRVKEAIEDPTRLLIDL
jgi:2-oxoglutarate dehydrogenase E2 component (dihydrolipoamide succinyltransferase)